MKHIHIRLMLLGLITFLIKRYFKDGLTPIHGSSNWNDKVIGYRWAFYEEEFEDYRYGTNIKKQRITTITIIIVILVCTFLAGMLFQNILNK